MRFHSYCGLIRTARSGFRWENTRESFFASVYHNCETASRN